MKNTISKRIFIAIGMATILPAALAVFLLFYLLNANDRLVLGHLKNISSNKNEILNSYRTLIVEKKHSLELKTFYIGLYLKNNLPESASGYQAFFEELTNNYPELTSVSVFPDFNLNINIFKNLYEENLFGACKKAIIPEFVYRNPVMLKGNRKYIIRYQNVKNGKYLRIITGSSSDFIKLYKMLASTYEDNDQMLSIYRGIRKYYWYFFFLSLLITGFLTYISTGSILKGIAKRISLLAEATRKIADEKLDIDVNVGGKDELTELAEEFNKMISELKTNRQKLIYHERMGVWQEVARKLAHEIKNPLTPILLAIQQIQNKVPEGNEDFKLLVERSASMIKEEVEELKRLVEAFGTLARLPDKKAKPIDVKQFTQEITEVANLSHGYEMVKTEYKFDSKITIMADRLLLKRTFMNLIDNALQADNSKQPEINLTVRLDEDHVIFDVTDHGCGIKEPDKVFEPYFTTKEYGTGLGLSLAKKIILDHGGNIVISETSDKGTTFTVSLPVLRER